MDALIIIQEELWTVTLQ